MPRGRPKRQWTPEELAEIEKLAGIGLTAQQIGDYYGIADSSVRDRAYHDPIFSDAIKRGRSKVGAKIAATVAGQAMNGNLGAAIFYLKCQQRWSAYQPQPIEQALQTLIDNDILPPDWAEKSGEVVLEFQQKLVQALAESKAKKRGKK